LIVVVIVVVVVGGGGLKIINIYSKSPQETDHHIYLETICV
jgi:cell division GTPase FtsZ